MGTISPIDREAANRFFASTCFNETWTLLDKTDRTPDDERLMIATSMASIYHWIHRPDCTQQHLSIGYWQVSRVHAVLRRSHEAIYFAELCESYSRDLSPFYRGYALEAIARAAMLAGDADRSTRAKSDARQLLEQIADVDDRNLLAADLDTI